VTTEAGGKASFTVKLESKPKEVVTIPVVCDDPSEGRVDVTSLVFTVKNWKEPQTVTVTGQQDRVQDGGVAYAITLGPARSDDANYKGFSIKPVVVMNADDDEAGIDLSVTPGQTTSETGEKVRLELALRSQPTAEVVLPLTVSDDREAMVAPASITFTPMDWADAKTVTVIGKADHIQDGSVVYDVNVGPAVSDDVVYRGMKVDPISLLNRDATNRNVVTKTGNGIVDGRNAKRPIDVRVMTVPQGKRKFTIDDVIQFRVTADQPGHIILMLVSLDDPKAPVTIVYPNVEQRIQLVEPGGQIVAPKKGVITDLPTGKVLVKAILTPRPVPLASPGSQSVAGGLFRLGLKNMGTENDDNFEIVQDLSKIFGSESWSTAELITVAFTSAPVGSKIGRAHV